MIFLPVSFQLVDNEKYTLYLLYELHGMSRLSGVESSYYCY